MSAAREETNDRLLSDVTRRAQALWGEERTRELSAALAHTAEALTRIAEHRPDPEEEPDIFGQP